MPAQEIGGAYAMPSTSIIGKPYGYADSACVETSKTSYIGRIVISISAVVSLHTERYGAILCMDMRQLEAARTMQGDQDDEALFDIVVKFRRGCPPTMFAFFNFSAGLRLTSRSSALVRLLQR